MQEAYYCYARWGAKTKVEDLEQRYPELLRVILQQKALKLDYRERLSNTKDYGNLPKVNCHAKQINQVLMNILNNAIDALNAAAIAR